jgi:hypothetical protein
MLVAVALHASDVPLDCVEIRNEDGSIEVLETHACGAPIAGRV